MEIEDGSFKGRVLLTRYVDQLSSYMQKSHRRGWGGAAANFGVIGDCEAQGAATGVTGRGRRRDSSW